MTTLKTKHRYFILTAQTFMDIGYAMSQSLPYSEFQWLTEEEINNLDVINYKADNAEGMILEVDLEYPQHLHNDHADYPLAPEKINIDKEMLSPHAKEFLTAHNLTHTKQTRLAPNLYDKEKYIVNIKTLQLITWTLGLQLITWISFNKDSPRNQILSVSLVNAVH